MKTLNRNNRGLTLVELLVGIAILAIVITPLLHTFITGAKTENTSRRYGEATSAAQNLSEQIQAFDMDAIFNNAGLIDRGAAFYSADGALIGSAGDSGAAGNFIRIPGYSYGSSKFDALITIAPDAESPANNISVSVSNRIDAYLDMAAADGDAYTALLAACDGLKDAAPSKEELNRSIEINMSKDGANNFTVTAVFSYSAAIRYTGENTEGEPTDEIFRFGYTKEASALISAVKPPSDGQPAFSTYLFFDGHYKNTVAETININNPTGTEINVFLVNTNKTGGGSYSASINYRKQQFKNEDEPLNRLVYTNLPTGNISYYAWKTEIMRKTVKIESGLVETAVMNRKFNINIKLFKSGDGFSGDPILNLDSVKLS